MISYDTLKKYKGVIDPNDYQLIKKDLKILNAYRKKTRLFSVNDSMSITGAFIFIANEDEDFDYFRKNEYLPKKEEENATRNK